MVYQVFETANTSTENQSCFEFSANQLENVIIGKPTLAAISTLACLLAVIVIIALKEYKKFVHRLVLYLMVAGFVHGITIGLEVVPVYHTGTKVAVRKGLNDLCAAIGFITQTTMWMFNMIIIWIVTYLFLLGVFRYSANKRTHEVTGIVVSLVFPLTFNWVPFIENMYGLAGLWCWIKLTKGDCHNDYTIGIIYQFSLFYGPLVVLILLSFISCVLIVIMLCRQQTRGSNLQQSSLYHQALKEALPLLIYPFIYDIICSLMVANRIYYAITVAQGKHPYYPLWLIHALVDPTRVLTPPLAFLLHPNTLRKLFCKKSPQSVSNRNHSSITAYIVSAEYPYTEEDPLIIRGSEDEETDGSQYKSIFEGDVQ